MEHASSVPLGSNVPVYSGTAATDLGGCTSVYLALRLGQHKGNLINLSILPAAGKRQSRFVHRTSIARSDTVYRRVDECGAT